MREGEVGGTQSDRYWTISWTLLSVCVASVTKSFPAKHSFAVCRPSKHRALRPRAMECSKTLDSGPTWPRGRVQQVSKVIRLVPKTELFISALYWRFARSHMTVATAYSMAVGLQRPESVRDRA